MEQWSAFAVIAGGGAAGLTGLLFVAVSIRIEVIAKSQELRNRAAQTLALFVSVLFISLLLSIPDQSLQVLELELLALAVIIGGGMLIAGVLLVFGVHGGLDVLVLPVFVALAGGVTSAWLLLTKVPD